MSIELKLWSGNCDGMRFSADSSGLQSLATGRKKVVGLPEE
jgi:hypothetical protein